MKITLIRHGQTDWNVEDRIQGQLPIPLNSKGIAQARFLRQFFNSSDFDYIITSKLLRAQQTTTGVFPDVKDIDTYSELNERHFGVWQTRLWKSVLKDHPEMDHPWSENAQDVKPPGGESLLEFIQRARDGFLTVISKYPLDSNIAIVSHGGNLKSILSYIYRDMPWNLKLPSQKNCSINVVEFDGKNFKILEAGKVLDDNIFKI